MKNTGQLEREIHERISQATNNNIFNKIRVSLSELEHKDYASSTTVKEGSDYSCVTWEFEFSSQMDPKTDINIHWYTGGHRCGKMSMQLHYNGEIVFEASSSSGSSDDHIITCYKPGKWEGLIVPGEMIKFIENDTEVARVKKIESEVELQKENERIRKESLPSSELVIKASQFDISLE